VKEAKRGSSGFSHRDSHKSKKTYHGRSFFDKQLNSEYSPNAKLIFLGIAFIAILIGGFILVQGPLFHSLQQSQTACHIFPSSSSPDCTDPIQTIWNSSSINDFNLYAGNKTINTVSACFDFLPASASCLNLQASHSNATLIALSKTTIGDLSSASKYLLGFSQSFGISNLLTANSRWGYYLTTNGTIPRHDLGSSNNYDPENDPSVVLSDSFFCDANCSSANIGLQDNIFLLRTIGKGDTIRSEATSCGSGPHFLCDSQTIPTGFVTCPNGSFTGCVSSALYLNFTGVVNGNSCTITNGNGIGPAAGCSWAENSPYATVDSTRWVSSQTLPWFQLQASQYYIGFFAMSGAGSIAFGFDNGSHATSPAFSGMKIFLYTPSTTNPSIDTGGFFGPVIKTLISIGVFMAQNIINFMNFLSSIFAPLLAGIIAVFGVVFTTVFNAIGGIFGDSSLGTQIGTFFSGLSSYLANTFSNSIAFLSTAVTFLSNALSILSAFFSGGNSFIGLWTNLLSGLASLITGLNGFLSVLLYFYNLGVFGFNIIIIVLVGILAVSAVLDWIQTDNAVAGFVAIIMTFFLLYVLQTGNSSLNVVATNATILTSYQTAWNNTLFFVKLAPVLFFAMFMEWINGTDEVQRLHGGTEFMPNFQSMLKFDIMITTDIFKGGYWFFKEAFDIVSKGLSAIKGRWSPVEVAGTG